MGRWLEFGGKSGNAGGSDDSPGLTDTVLYTNPGRSKEGSGSANRLLIVKEGLSLNFIDKISNIGALGGYDIVVANSKDDFPASFREIDPTVVFLDRSVSAREVKQFLLYLPFDYRIGVIERDGHRDLIDNLSTLQTDAAEGSEKSGAAMRNRHEYEWEPAETGDEIGGDICSDAEHRLAQFSHELRTPLNSILGFSDVLLAEIFGGIANDKQREYIENVRHSGQYLLELINDILDYSAFEAGKLELFEDEIDIEATILDCVRLTLVRADQAEIDLSTDIQDNLPTLVADSRRIKQILLNLMSNAIKFTPPGETVIVGARLRAERELDIFVSDTGIGMDAAGLEIARRKFGQIAGAGGEHEGSGLGLPIALALTEAQGGTLELESALGTGTTAHVRFPL
ncbi:MAG: ATP-binding protein [Rhodospirillales bacterium]|jgi:signal transduction histidine kinase|nr:hypothetical protein [Rhodospirillaceae bacterium]MDP6429224.1 ATP-binding protein [Rhodospirillales bacterium]|tara:strand:- start:1194 stop:2390 length:1197 start_codon:yes stop_codon:yes gene_type:complete